MTYFYDATSVPHGRGRLATVSSSVSTYNYSSYDALGRVLGASQVIGSKTYELSYEYNLAGGVTKLTYPSGHVVNYNYDNAGRLADKDAQNLALTGNLGDGVLRTYTSEAQHSSFGGLQEERFGTTSPIYHKQRYNVRGQLWDIRTSTVPFSTDPANGDRGAIVNYYSNSFTQGGSGTDNNGNLLRQEHHIPGPGTPGFFQQNFAYDSLNRLSSITEKRNGTGADSFKQSYLYDRWGNRTIDQANTSGAGIPRPVFIVNASNNRLGVPSGQSGTMSYDNAGNLTTDTYSAAAVTRVYDAENKMTSETSYNSVVVGSYSNDGEGRRVKRVVAGVETWQIYGIGGELIGEYAAHASAASPQREYGYRNGQLLITATVTSGWGAAPTLSDNPLVENQIICWLLKLLLFFDKLRSCGRVRSHYPFLTLKERDVETGLDYFLARYYSFTQGRFTSTDPLMASGRAASPQSWNRYSYVLNNPLKFVDPTGLQADDAQEYSFNPCEYGTVGCNPVKLGSSL